MARTRWSSSRRATRPWPRWSATRRTDRVRFAAADRVPAVVQQAAAVSGVYLASQPVLIEGHVELLWYVQEQSISFDYHRYGNLGPRSGEERAAVL